MKSIISILLALIFLFGNLGMVYSTHYCGGKIVKSNLSIGSSDVSCGMAMTIEKNDCESEQFTNAPCCENEFLALDIEDEYHQDYSFAQIDVLFVTAFIYSYLADYLFQSTSIKIEDNAPPLLNNDIFALFQRYLL